MQQAQSANENNVLLEFIQKSQYEFEILNGQRIFGPPRNWVGPPPPKNTEIYIARLPNDAFEHDIVPIFSWVGQIYKLRIMQNFSGLNRGFAFLQYFTEKEADLAIQKLNDYEIRPNEKILVVRSRNNCKLQLENLPKNITHEKLKEELMKCTENVADVVMHINKETNSISAFVEYENHKAAAKARRKLVPSNFTLMGKPVTVNWSNFSENNNHNHFSNNNYRRNDANKENNHKSNTALYCKNIKPTAKDEELHRFFSANNNLKIIKLKKFSNSALIIYSSNEEAQIAFNIINDYHPLYSLLTEDNSKFEVSWSKSTLNQETIDNARLRNLL